MTATPFPVGTKISRTVGTEELGLALILDAAGADAIGLVTANPAAFSLLGRLKAISDNTDALEGFLDQVEQMLTDVKTLLTTQNGYVDGMEALVGATNTLLTTLGGYEDGQEGLLTDLRTLLTTQAGYLDGVETLLTTNNTITASTAPADDIFSITPSDTVALATVPKALLVLTAGNVAVRGTGSNPVTIPVVAGQTLPIRARYVYATNTTATVVGLV